MRPPCGMAGDLRPLAACLASFFFGHMPDCAVHMRAPAVGGASEGEREPARAIVGTSQHKNQWNRERASASQRGPAGSSEIWEAWEPVSRRLPVIHILVGGDSESLRVRQGTVLVRSKSPRAQAFPVPEEPHSLAHIHCSKL